MLQEMQSEKACWGRAVILRYGFCLQRKLNGSLAWGKERVLMPFSFTMLEPVCSFHYSVSNAWVYSCQEHHSVVRTDLSCSDIQQLLNHVFIFHRFSFKAWHPFHYISCMSYVCHCSKTNSVFIFLFFSLFPPILFLSHALCSLSGF